jgi:hypothetical protein
MKKVFVSTAVIFLTTILSGARVHAADFSTTYDVTYTVNDDGKITVDQNIKLTNLNAEFYSNQYVQSVGGIKIDELKATDKSGTIPSKIVKTASSSAIQLNFANQVVGKNSVRNFAIQYTTNSVSEKQGKTWNITLPRVNGDGIQTYTAHVSVPKSFGTATAIYPKEKSKEVRDGRTLYTFDTKQITTSGITLNFGDTQVYTLGLTYHLKNPKSESVYTDIALPMNTAYQTIQIDSLVPKPEKITVDPDGNYIARYVLKPKQDLEVILSGKAAVTKTKSNPTPQLNEKEKKILTQKQKYWEIDDARIASLAADLKTPENIYRYVVNTLKYDNSKLNATDFKRNGAAESLNKPNESVCMEFTDLFIALARAAGIPAREVNGYAYTDDNTLRPVSLSQDILHAWPEYWDDEKGWVQVDPTWENTTGGIDYFNVFDLNHIAFVRKGSNSESPYPAGSYKTKDNHSRDVMVSFADDELALTENFEVKINAPGNTLAGVVRKGDVMLTNNGNTALQGNMYIDTVYKKNQSGTENYIVIPPYATLTQPLPNVKTNYTDDSEINTVVSFKDKKAENTIKVLPFYKYTVTYIGLIYLIGIPVLALITYNLLHKRYEKRK